MYKVSSEIYNETDFQPEKGANGQVVSKFKFTYPEYTNCVTVDSDGDLVVQRKSDRLQTAEIEIEHSEATELRLVGLQVWRGALLLADYFFHRRADWQEKRILELGAGVGLTSIAAAIYTSTPVVCTDVNIGGILDLIRANVKRNRKLLREDVQVLEYDFLREPQDYAPALCEAIDGSEIVFAADVIYDDELTDAFIRVIDYIFERAAASGKQKLIYIALEKRYVFTLSELDTVAPMFEYFLRQTMKKTWHFEYVPTDFPQYFQYERTKHLVLLKLSYR